MPNRILLIVRHGQYRSITTPPNEPDGPLTARGQEQAVLTAKRLREYPVRVIHHSTLQRAIETAEIIAQEFPGVILRPSSLLRECIPCVPPGFERYFTHIPPEFIAVGPQQAQDAFAAYFLPPTTEPEDEYEIIVSHGNLINYLSSQVVRAPKESWLTFDVQQGSLTEVVIDTTGWMKLVRHNDTGHIPSNLRTFI